MNSSKDKRIRRHKRVRAKVSGTKETPRLCVFKSNQHIYAQIINDDARKTLASANDKAAKKTEKKMDRAALVGTQIAEKAKELKITKVVFDRGGYKYHGRVKAVAEGARKGGLKF